MISILALRHRLPRGVRPMAFRSCQPVNIQFDILGNHIRPFNYAITLETFRQTVGIF